MKELLLYILAEIGGVLALKEPSWWGCFLVGLVPAAVFFFVHAHWFIERSKISGY